MHKPLNKLVSNGCTFYQYFSWLINPVTLVCQAAFKETSTVQSITLLGFFFQTMKMESIKKILFFNPGIINRKNTFKQNQLRILKI